MFSCMYFLSYTCYSRWWQGKKKYFSKYLFLNSIQKLVGGSGHTYPPQLLVGKTCFIKSLACTYIVQQFSAYVSPSPEASNINLITQILCAWLSNQTGVRNKNGWSPRASVPFSFFQMLTHQMDWQTALGTKKKKMHVGYSIEISKAISNPVTQALQQLTT